ncbi:MAG: hypothetical protein D3923_09825 [Candidatus Electrothrix sp. AR3]|nr:hypothetical protein [Candidatus Electrothrix sp. AR3]
MCGVFFYVPFPGREKIPENLLARTNYSFEKRRKELAKKKKKEEKKQRKLEKKNQVENLPEQIDEQQHPSSDTQPETI